MALLQELRTIGRMYVTGKLSQKDALAHALTTYDRAQEGKRGHNPNALNIYLERLDEFCDGQMRIDDAFCDRLLRACEIALGRYDRF